MIKIALVAALSALSVTAFAADTAEPMGKKPMAPAMATSAPMGKMDAKSETMVKHGKKKSVAKHKEVVKTDDGMKKMETKTEVKTK